MYGYGGLKNYWFLKNRLETRDPLKLHLYFDNKTFNVGL